MIASAATPRFSIAPIASRLRGHWWIRFSRRGKTPPQRRSPTMRQEVGGRKKPTIWWSPKGSLGANYDAFCLRKLQSTRLLPSAGGRMILAGDIGGTKTNLGLFDTAQGTLVK